MSGLNGLLTCVYMFVCVHRCDLVSSGVVATYFPLLLFTSSFIHLLMNLPVWFQTTRTQALPTPLVFTSPLLKNLAFMMTHFPDSRTL